MSSDLPSSQGFITLSSLYSPTEFSGDQAIQIFNLQYFDGTYDSYCLKCRRESTFKVTSPALPATLERTPFTGDVRVSRLHPGILNISNGSFQLKAACARYGGHIQEFFFHVSSEIVSAGKGKPVVVQSVAKIGQYPSFADLHLEGVKKYRGSLPPTQLRELSQAIGLASHDVGIGSYVYLRRVFEWLVEEARQLASSEDGWDEEVYSRARMSEKIAILRQHLPAFLAEHPEVYGILSKGVHELTEAECLVFFPTLRISIELILDERHEKKVRDKKIAQAEKELAEAVANRK